MSATEVERQRAQTGGAPWRDRERLAALARRHTLPAGLAIGIGALLRLLWLGDTAFLGDQAQLLALGRSAADHRAFIITGIPSSIGTLNPPVSTWLYAPFALLGSPLGATIFTALANIVAIALLYALATRYLGRRAGFAAALLYATASGPVHYARFIWQQNLLAPIVLLLFWAILLAVIERRRGWLGWSILLWGAATELHPTAAPLLGLVAVALAFTWRELRRRDLAWAAAALIALFGPTALWEVVSHGADLLGAQRFSQGHAVFDTWALTYLFELITPAPATWYGAASSYLHTGLALEALTPLMLILIVAAHVWLVGVIVTPWIGARAGAVSARAALANGLANALADARWRLALCLALWVALPLAFLLRHSRPVEPHYLLVLLPAVYLSMGAFLARASRWLQDALEPRIHPASQGQALAIITLVAVIVAMSAAQTVGVGGELATIHAGAFDALALPLHYGTPLSSEQDALAATQSAARRLHATVAIAATRVEQEPLGYLSATTAPGSVATDYISAGCLVTPAPDAQAPLVTLAVPATTAAQLLPHIQGARTLGAVAVQGGWPYLLYDIAPGASVVGEHPIASPGASGQPQPAAYAYTPATTPTTSPAASASVALTIRWTGAPDIHQAAASAVSYWYGAAPNAAPIADYTFTAQALDAQGQPIGVPITSVCARLTWSRQMSLITTMRLPASLLAGGHVAAWRVSAQGAPAVATRPTLGPLTLETGAITFGPARPLGQPMTFAATSP